MTLRLYVGNKNYSSWSLRAWLVLAESGLAFEEVVIPMRGPGVVTPEIAERSPSGRVPLLEHDGVQVWDSLAIAEYVAELAPGRALWPADRSARAIARSVSAEMHSGFAAVRRELPMNVRRRTESSLSRDAADEVRRITRIWSDCRARFGAGGDLLFGAFSIADAMFAPIATRFATYAVDLDEGARAYVSAITALPSMKRYTEAALAEPWAIEGYDSI